MFLTKPERFLDAETIKRVERIALVHGAENAVKARTYAIGDIHGMKDYLLNLLEFITETQKTNILYPSRFVFMGDYVDRGPEVSEVIAVIRLLQELMPEGDVVALMGNHEAMFIEELEVNGCVRYSKNTRDSFAKYGFRYKVPDDVVDWLKNLSYYYEDDKHYYVHAGFQPGVPIEKQDKETMIWIREQFLYSKFNFGKRVIHGHTPRLNNIEQTEYRTNLDCGGCFGGSLMAAEIRSDRDYPVGFFLYKEGEKSYFKIGEDYRYSKQ